MPLYEERKRDLLELRRRLLRQVAQLEDDLRWLETDVESELVEAGQEETLARLVARLSEHDRDELAAIDNALDRIERGEGDVCRTCRKRIPEQRLRALPTTDICLSCASARENLTRGR
ncbi:MAG TPA: TraR/DksA C4-type zinc finger protein [Candidatus Dormibacteraeota bacterium]|nr:TraR/DksA C4-type zinc finger protein [Candidatus Dormibacteraeota bacterium]